MGKIKLIKEAKGYIQHEIAPALSPNITGKFQVRLIGLNHGAAEIELRIVDENGNSLKSFGSKVISPGRTITLEGLESKINFLPPNFEVKP